MNERDKEAIEEIVVNYLEQTGQNNVDLDIWVEKLCWDEMIDALGQIITDAIRRERQKQLQGVLEGGRKSN